MRPSAALPNKEMAWLTVPFLFMPLTYGVISTIARAISDPNMSAAELFAQPLVWLFIGGVAAIPTYLFGMPVTWVLERLRLTGYLAFAIAGALAGIALVLLLDVLIPGPVKSESPFHDPLLMIEELGAIHGAACALAFRWVAGWRRRLPVLSDHEAARPLR